MDGFDDDPPMVLPPVVVTAPPQEPYEPYYSNIDYDPFEFMFLWEAPSISDGSGGGSGDSEDGDCSGGGASDGFPGGVDMGELRSTMSDLGQTLSNLRSQTGYEWGAFVLQSTSSDLMITTPPFTSGNSDSIEPSDWIDALLNYEGALEAGVVEIVGWIHVQSSPLPSGDGNALSGGEGDWGVANALVDIQYADENLMTYIVDEDGNVYEYSMSDEGTEQTGDEVSGTC
ncbi:MAG: hypothetical protein AAFR74_08360 [Pseudomonadota bacterium]